MSNEKQDPSAAELAGLVEKLQQRIEQLEAQVAGLVSSRAIPRKTCSRSPRQPPLHGLQGQGQGRQLRKQDGLERRQPQGADHQPVARHDARPNALTGAELMN